MCYFFSFYSKYLTDMAFLFAQQHVLGFNMFIFLYMFVPCMHSYHLRCLGRGSSHTACAQTYKCLYCRSLVDGSSLPRGGGPLVIQISHVKVLDKERLFLFITVSLICYFFFLQRFDGKRPELETLIEFLSNNIDFCVW